MVSAVPEGIEERAPVSMLQRMSLRDIASAIMRHLERGDDAGAEPYRQEALRRANEGGSRH